MKIEGSSNIAEIDYEPESRHMTVKFHSGSVYHFSGVSADDHRNFLAADSKGKHFHRHIRGMFDSKRIT